MNTIIRYGMALVVGVGLSGRLDAAPPVAVPAAQPAAPAEESFLVKIKGMDGQVSMEVMNTEEKKKIEKDLQLEQRYFSDVVRKVGQEWTADESNKGIPYPGFRLFPRRLITSERFPSREKAEKQLSMYEERDSKKSAPKPAGKNDKAAEKEAQLSRAMDLVKSRLDEVIATKTAPAPTPEKNAAGPAGAPPAKDAVKKAL